MIVLLYMIIGWSLIAEKKIKGGESNIVEEGGKIQIDPALLNTIVVGLFTLFGASFGGFISYWINRQRLTQEEKQQRIEKTEEHFKNLAENILNPIFYELRSNAIKLNKTPYFLLDVTSYDFKRPVEIDLDYCQERVMPDLREWESISKHKRSHFFDKLWNDLTELYLMFREYEWFLDFFFTQFRRTKAAVDSLERPEVASRPTDEEITRLLIGLYRKYSPLVSSTIQMVTPIMVEWSREISTQIGNMIGLIRSLSVGSEELEKLSDEFLSRQYKSIDVKFFEGTKEKLEEFYQIIQYASSLESVKMFDVEIEYMTERLKDSAIEKQERDELERELRLRKIGREVFLRQAEAVEESGILEKSALKEILDLFE